jgi:hypothetical protein
MSSCKIQRKESAKKLGASGYLNFLDVFPTAWLAQVLFWQLFSMKKKVVTIEMENNFPDYFYPKT